MIFFSRKPTFTRPVPVLVPFEKEGRNLSLEEFETLTGATFLSQLFFPDFRILQKISKWTSKLQKRGELSCEQLWLGSYFSQELALCPSVDVVIRWIDPILGWGVFAARDFKKMEFIAEYTGVVRKRVRADVKNAYCFEYAWSSEAKTPYVIDARERGGVARYINHSETPNLLTALVTVESKPHVVLYTKDPIRAGTQLLYHYGPDYWAQRKPPRNIS
jgi:hypothetical protein